VSKQTFGNDKLQDRVTEEFEALIIEMIAPGFVPDARMGERLHQQKRISKLVANAFFERSHGLAILSETEESLNCHSRKKHWTNCSGRCPQRQFNLQAAEDGGHYRKSVDGALKMAMAAKGSSRYRF
jgi:hypothetical protein